MALPSPGQRLFLFDIDNTLLYTGGAGSRAMDIAFERLHGVAKAFADISLAGRTDTAILRDALTLHNLLDGSFSPLLRRFRASYCRHLARTLGESQGQVLPGVQQLLDALGSAGELLGLATGNFRRSAFMKLRHYRLDGYFLHSPEGSAATGPAAPQRLALAGAFGDDAEERARIVALAARRLARRAGRPLSGCRLYVVGDTPGDIAAATANGACAIGVATGSYSCADLTGAGAHLVLPDLGDKAGVLAALATL